CPAKTDHSPRVCGLPYFNAERVNEAVWDWLSAWLNDETQLRQGLRAYQAEQQELSRPIREQLDSVTGLLDENRAKMDRLVSLFVEGDIPRDILTERKARLAETIQALTKEETRLQATLTGQTMTDKEIDTIAQFGAKIAQGLAKVEARADRKREIVEALHIRVKLAVEDGQKVAYVSCHLGEERLLVESRTS
ncbi:MAG TPA: hypothetical protein VM366_02020, partial [Anaerolineae bacterium]|nr:hypothetical protein [Anaerolineae bacterium]